VDLAYKDHLVLSPRPAKSEVRRAAGSRFGCIIYLLAGARSQPELGRLKCHREATGWVKWKGKPKPGQAWTPGRWTCAHESST